MIRIGAGFGSQRMDKVAVIIATRGRPTLVRFTVELLARQSRPADHIFVVGTCADDLPHFEETPLNVTAVIGRTGLPLQRNDGLKLAGDAFDAIAFFDDDFVPSLFWLENAITIFARDPELSGLTGRLIADGIKSPGIPLDEAMERLAPHDASRYCPDAIHEGFGPYGCNMAFRFDHIRGLAFDERLPLYAWLEDSDFGGQIVRRGGRTARADALWGIHLGNKNGRERGVRLGYAQVANPAYLLRKGTLPAGFLMSTVLKNVAANMARAFRSEPFIDRPGRLKGNLIAISDVLRGRSDPQRMTAL